METKDYLMFLFCIYSIFVELFIAQSKKEERNISKGQEQCMILVENLNLQNIFKTYQPFA